MDTKTKDASPALPLAGVNPNDEANSKETEKLNTLVSGFNPQLPIYIMWYRRGNRQPESKGFQLDGNLSKAIIRSRNYCEKLNYRFCGTFPFLIDLDKEEYAHLNGTYE